MTGYYEASADDGCRLYLVKWRERAEWGDYNAKALVWSESGDRAILCLRKMRDWKSVNGTLWTAAVRDAGWMERESGGGGIKDFDNLYDIIHPDDADERGVGWQMVQPANVYVVLRQREREQRDWATHPTLPLMEEMT